jgi:hypothetical protein
MNAANTMISDEAQLGYTLRAFGFAHDKGPDWAPTFISHFKTAGITSIQDLQYGVMDNTLNLDLELFGVRDRFVDTLPMQSFLPGPRGIRCFRLAQQCARSVRAGTANTEYVHRPESGKVGNELFKLTKGSGDWILHVDCAGFVRNCLKHVTKDPFVMELSDRDFMRAKDFFGFFQACPYSVLDGTLIPETDKRMKWRLVPDLRMVIPGDVIVYRPRGSAAGGAAYTTNDRKDLAHLLKAIKTSQLWHTEQRGSDEPRNFAKDARVKPWVVDVKNKLQSVGIHTVKDLCATLATLNDKLAAAGYSKLYQDTVNQMQACIETTAMNTGHIVFCSGPAVAKENDAYRIRVVHSTKYGAPDANGNATTGIEEHYRRFRLVKSERGKEYWTREMKKAPLVKGLDSDSEDDNPNDDMDEDEDENGDALDETQEAPGDDLAGQAHVDVLAVRMCF